MSLQRGIDDAGSPRREPVARRGELLEERRTAAAGVMAVGTLACPACDVPVSPAHTLSPADALACPLCAHAGAVRDFLSLDVPSRPARVTIVVR